MPIRIPTRNIIMAFVAGTFLICFSVWGFLNGWGKFQFNFQICLLIFGFGLYLEGCFLIFKREVKPYEAEYIEGVICILIAPLMLFSIDFDANYYVFAVPLFGYGLVKFFLGWQLYEKSKAQS